MTGTTHLFFLDLFRYFSIIFTFNVNRRPDPGQIFQIALNNVDYVSVLVQVTDLKSNKYFSSSYVLNLVVPRGPLYKMSFF
jgi:hypothetical protein